MNCAAWNRALSAEEIAALSENPWQVFKKRTWLSGRIDHMKWWLKDRWYVLSWKLGIGRDE